MLKCDILSTFFSMPKTIKCIETKNTVQTSNTTMKHVRKESSCRQRSEGEKKAKKKEEHHSEFDDDDDHLSMSTNRSKDSHRYWLSLLRKATGASVVATRNGWMPRNQGRRRRRW